MNARWHALLLSLWRHRERVLLCAAALALVTCMWRPEWPLQRRVHEHVVVLDITQSMNVLDQLVDGQPASRLAHAKHALQQALKQLPCGSKLGWAVFTEYRSYLLFAPVEVCANLRELRSTLAAIDSRMAWVGGSEIAKGLHSGLATVKQLPGVPALVFVTDGQEAPPINPRHRPAFDDQPGEVQGFIVGVGDTRPSPIPKTDPLGRPLGVWRADDVAQTDPRSQGRGASVGGEKLAESEGDGGPAAGLGATPGSEHLSGLREPYLQLLASERGLGYLQLTSADALAAALLNPAHAKPAAAQADARVALGGLAMLLLLACHVRRRAAARQTG
jgi:mxaL protein